MEKVIVGCLVLFMLSVSISSNVFANWGERPILASEPICYLLIAAGGAVLVGVRHWMTKRRCKKGIEAHH